MLGLEMRWVGASQAGIVIAFLGILTAGEASPQNESRAIEVSGLLGRLVNSGTREVAIGELCALDDQQLAMTFDMWRGGVRRTLDVAICSSFAGLQIAFAAPATARVSVGRWRAWTPITGGPRHRAPGTE